MAVPWDVILFLTAFAIILVLLVRLATKARGAESSATMQENPREAMLLRFLDDDAGKRIGETVALEGDDFIVKDAQGFLAVPAAQVREEGPGLRLSGALDLEGSRRKGEAWRERSHKVITYSESELPKDEPEG